MHSRAEKLLGLIEAAETLLELGATLAAPGNPMVKWAVIVAVQVIKWDQSALKFWTQLIKSLSSILWKFI